VGEGADPDREEAGITEVREKEMKSVKKVVVLTLLVFAVSLIWMPSAAWAFRCTKLYKEALELIDKGGKAPKVLEEAKKLAEEGIRLHAEGKHKESVKVLNKALEMLKG